MSRKKTILHYLYAYGLAILTIIVINSISSLIVFSKLDGMVRGNTQIDSIVYYESVLSFVSILTPVIGGVVLGYIMKKKGWLHASILAICIKSFSIIVICTIFFNPTFFYGGRHPSQYAYELALKNILRLVLSLPFTVALVGIGGWFGELLSKKPILNKLTEEH